ncbi:unnamed protein product [Brassica oleracea var. botrytis]|uniref:(rape) hypothetical protein n=1 Tax=Brassica napus TaxID=3708 RepID=A0A816QWL1_BRANA|nr:unnamed protein product [Brassica napus]
MMKSTQPQSSSSFVKFCRKLSPKRKDSPAESTQHNINEDQDKNKDLEAVFAYMDANRDGRISPHELQKSFMTLGEQLSDEEAEAAVRLSDTDGDGMLDFQEFAQLIKGDDDQEEKKTELKEAFRMYIAEGEECITPRSLKMMLKKLDNKRRRELVIMKNTQRQLSSSFMKLCERLSSDINGENKNKDLAAVFAYMDANRDGRISAEELKKSFKTLGEQLSDEEAETAVKLSDIDGDGMLDFEEFAQLLKGGDEFTEEEKKSKIMEAFRMYIAEGEDCITPRSLKMMLMKLGESRTTDDCVVMIKAFDLNADGVLSFDEFALMVMR